MTFPTTAPHAPSPLPAPAPSWRACVGQALRCWSGGVLVTLVLVPMLAFGDVTNLLVTFGGFLLLMLAIGLISTLTALVIESLTSRRVPVGGHVGLIALAGMIVTGLFSFDSWIALAAFVACLIAAALGALIGIGRPTWRRYLIALGVAIALGLLQLVLG